MFRLYEGARVASAYRKYRPTVPESIVSRILNYIEEELQRPHDLAVDVGCGSGQVTLPLAPHFRRLIGCDVSEAQIQEGRNRPDRPSNVSFVVAPAEKLPVEDGSAQLICGGMCFHWFDLPKFYAEVDRILVPNGVVAAIGYKIPKAIHPAKGVRLNELLDAFLKDYLLKDTCDRKYQPLENYKDLELPYTPQVRHSEVHSTVHGTVADLMGYIDAWSCFESPERTTVLETFKKQVFQVLEVGRWPEKVPLTLRYDFCVAMCRKPISPSVHNA